MGRPCKFDRSSAKRMRDNGVTFREIGAALGVTHTAVILALRKMDRQPATRPKKASQRILSAGGYDHTKQRGRPRIKVPTWVSSAHLDEEYRELTNTRGEFVAASHCRALLREMRTSS